MSAAAVLAEVQCPCGKTVWTPRRPGDPLTFAKCVHPDLTNPYTKDR